MINVPTRVTQPTDRMSIQNLNKKVSRALDRNSILTADFSSGQTQTQAVPQRQAHTVPQVHAQTVNPTFSQTATPAFSQTAAPAFSQTVTPAFSQGGVQTVPRMSIPTLRNPLQKGQKTSLNLQGNSCRLKACFGWNVKDNRCDIDVSAFLITQNGKVPSDDWFVFYGQEVSPDGSVHFFVDQSRIDREYMDINLAQLNPQIQKIVLVMTINEAFEQRLNFSMIEDAYVRIMDAAANREILSYRIDQYYANVTSMTIGELYLHNGLWKFNPVGNGVSQDLAGQCAIYGVEIG